MRLDGHRVQGSMYVVLECNHRDEWDPVRVYASEAEAERAAEGSNHLIVEQVSFVPADMQETARR